jgi:hypothetical protein
MLSITVALLRKGSRQESDKSGLRIKITGEIALFLIF